MTRPLIFSTPALELLKGSGKQSDSGDKPLSGIAYSGDAVTQWGERFVIDLASLQVETPRGLLYQHRHEAPIGVIDAIGNDGKRLTIDDARIFSGIESDPLPRQVVERAARGLPRTRGDRPLNEARRRAVSALFSIGLSTDFVDKPDRAHKKIHCGSSMCYTAGSGRRPGPRRDDMRWKSLVLAGALLAAGAVQGEEMTKWQYMIIGTYVGRDPLYDDILLNKMGERGWKIVGIESHGRMIYFARPYKGDPPPRENVQEEVKREFMRRSPQ